MKKIVPILSTVAAAALVLTACGGDSSSSGDGLSIEVPDVPML
jgi:ABC-type glycerol-3-phosphate transport system substrate-binding protein